MSLRRLKCFLNPSDLHGRWKIENPFSGGINNEPIEYHLLTTDTKWDFWRVTFYLHGLGGKLTDTPYLEDHICPNMPLVRLACFGLSRLYLGAVVSTFGDICTLLYNGRQSIITLADILGVESYNVVAHSWGGFSACLAALSDSRCKKAMLLVSTPDICDAISNMYKLVGLPTSAGPVADIFLGKLRGDALAAKFGKAKHQIAWNVISPYGEVANPNLRMLIYNRDEDQVMRKANVEHFVEYSSRRGAPNVVAEFNAFPELSHWHDMPLEKFSERMAEFLFGDG